VPQSIFSIPAHLEQSLNVFQDPVVLCCFSGRKCWVTKMLQTVCVVRPTSVLPMGNCKLQAGLGNAIAFLCTILSRAAVGKKVAVGFTYFRYFTQTTILGMGRKRQPECPR